jgi:hypothetical protein
MGQNVGGSDNCHFPTTKSIATDQSLIDVTSVWKAPELDSIALGRPLDFLLDALSGIVIEPHPADSHDPRSSTTVGPFLHRPYRNTGAAVVIAVQAV